MVTTKIHTAPDVYTVMIPFPNISTQGTNCYLIKEGNEVLVVDTGGPTNEGCKKFLQAFTELNIDPRKASFFLTHFHLDHAGLVDQIVPHEATLYVGLHEYDRTRQKPTQAYCADMFSRFRAFGAGDDEASMCEKMQIDMSHFVNDDHNVSCVNPGDIISIGSYDFEVIDTAGHTAGHLSLFERSSGLLFGGDHVLSVVSPSIDYFSGGQDSFASYLQNLNRLRDLPIKIVLNSHGNSQTDVISRIDWLLDHHEQRLEHIIEIVENFPGLKGMEIIRKLKWRVKEGNWDAISLPQRTVIVVQSLVLLDHLVGKDILEVRSDAEGHDRYYVSV